MKAEVFNTRWWVDNADARYLKHTLRAMADAAEFTILGYMDEAFTPYGYTGLWLLAESHLALHTFPEHNTAYIELSSCNKDKHAIFKQQMQVTFNKSARSV